MGAGNRFTGAGGDCAREEPAIFRQYICPPQADLLCLPSEKGAKAQNADLNNSSHIILKEGKPHEWKFEELQASSGVCH
jgi:hypothetical protein